jgi:histidine triad (HIT) family protein
LLGHLLAVAARLAREHGLTAGYKTQINTGHAGGQEVFHLHVHVHGHPR